MALHPSEGFTGTDVPQQMISAESGEMQIRFISDSLESSRGFSAVFSADCPDLVPGKGKMNYQKILRTAIWFFTKNSMNVTIVKKPL